MHSALRQVFQKTRSEPTTSYVNQIQKSKWSDEILSDEYCTYINLSCPAAGNTYIRSRLFEGIKKYQPDYVYLQFSGLYRNDLILEIENKNLAYQDLLMGGTRESDLHPFNQIRETDSKIYVCTGNFIVSGNNLCTIDKINLMKHSIKNENYNNDNSLQEIFTSISFLDKIGIPYNWTTYYDYTSPPQSNSIVTKEGYISKWPEWINLDKKISGSPLDFCIKNGHNPDDGIHYGFKWFIKFLEHHKKEFDLSSVINRNIGV
jgi:hypothetical protein